MIQFKFKKVISEIPAGHYPHQYPEVIRVEESVEFDFQRGQRVRVVDGSYNFDAQTGMERVGIDPLFKDYTATVIEIECQRFVEGVLDLIVQTDLRLLFEDGTEIYCASNCVRHI